MITKAFELVLGNLLPLNRVYEHKNIINNAQVDHLNFFHFLVFKNNNSPKFKHLYLHFISLDINLNTFLPFSSKTFFQFVIYFISMNKNRLSQ